jgi:uridylate kinase
LVKLSGESLKGNSNFGIDYNSLNYLANEFKDATKLGVQIAVVIGGGNFWRGHEWEALGMDRATADYTGMLATLMNALALQDAIEKNGMPVRTMSALEVQAVAETYIRRKATSHLNKKRIVIFGAGIGDPYMTTDTAAALRSIEIGADILCMSKNQVDGVYDSDPNNNPTAKKFDNLEYIDAINLRLKIMDGTALSLCMENDLPIVVFDVFKKGNLSKVLSGIKIGTTISNLKTKNI